MTRFAKDDRVATTRGGFLRLGTVTEADEYGPTRVDFDDGSTAFDPEESYLEAAADAVARLGTPHDRGDHSACDRNCSAVL